MIVRLLVLHSSLNDLVLLPCTTAPNPFRTQWPHQKLMACVASANFEDHPPPTQLAKRRKKRPSTIGKHCLLVAPSLAPNYMHQRWPQERNCKKEAFHSFQYFSTRALKKANINIVKNGRMKIPKRWSLSNVLLQSLVLFRKYIQYP